MAAAASRLVASSPDLAFARRWAVATASAAHAATTEPVPASSLASLDARAYKCAGGGAARGRDDPPASANNSHWWPTAEQAAADQATEQQAAADQATAEAPATAQQVAEQQAAHERGPIQRQQSIIVHVITIAELLNMFDDSEMSILNKVGGPYVLGASIVWLTASQHSGGRRSTPG
jgi:hypothetical protein